MAETVNQEQTTPENNGTEKTFTQEELNAIVNDRLARERKKYDGINLEELKSKAAKLDELEEASKTELEKEREKSIKLQAELDGIKRAEEIRSIRDKVSKETGVPADLLTAENEEACKAQAEAIKEFASPSSYPQVRDGGDPQHLNKRTTKDSFAQFASQLI